MSHHKSLFSRFLSNPTQVGALCPSSPALCRAITANVGIESAKFVVELGPGTGAITNEIVKKLTKKSDFIGIELDAKLHKDLEEKFPGIKFYNDNAANLKSIVEHNNHPAPDVIICGLPWAIFPDSLQNDIIGSITATLSPDGTFTTFAYLQGLLLPAGRKFRKRLSQNFEKVETSRVVWKNLPPAFIYRCRLAQQSATV